MLKGIFALEMTDDEKAFFRTIATVIPRPNRARKFGLSPVRRAGKDSVASAIGRLCCRDVHRRRQPAARRKRRGMCLACDRDQAKIVLNYTRSYFTEIDLFAEHDIARNAVGFELSNNIDIAVATNTFRSVRGRPSLRHLGRNRLLRDENSANPDDETFNALSQGLRACPGSMIIGISSPYRKIGLLYQKFRDHYGKDDSKVLVIKAPTRLLNPLIDQSVIDEAMAEDPAAASCRMDGGIS